MINFASPSRCRPCCGSDQFVYGPVLGDALITQWQLSPREVDYINRQQGVRCARCGNSLRAMALAHAIMRVCNFHGKLTDFIASSQANSTQVLEVNECGGLTTFLRHLKGYTFCQYPAVDITAMPFAANSFDLVVHSDTLEHVANPVKGLQECHRVLRPGGCCCYTIPIIVDRLTRSRAGLPASYHGAAGSEARDFLVHTEYGCDMWRHLFEAGFGECRIHAIEYPTALAVTGVK